MTISDDNAASEVRLLKRSNSTDNIHESFNETFPKVEEALEFKLPPVLLPTKQADTNFSSQPVVQINFVREKEMEQGIHSKFSAMRMLLPGNEIFFLNYRWRLSY